MKKIHFSRDSKHTDSPREKPRPLYNEVPLGTFLERCQYGMVLNLERCQHGMVLNLERSQHGMVLTLEICWDGMVLLLETCRDGMVLLTREAYGLFLQTREMWEVAWFYFYKDGVVWITREKMVWFGSLERCLLMVASLERSNHTMTWLSYPSIVFVIMSHQLLCKGWLLIHGYHFICHQKIIKIPNRPTAVCHCSGLQS